MQKQIENEFVLLSIPSELMVETGITPDALLQYSVDEGKIIIEAVDDVGNLVCKKNCHECPVSNGETTLFEFLNHLSEEQQHAALIHLSVLWAQKEGGTCEN